MRVLIAIPYLAAIYGGPPKVVEALAASLGKQGLAVDVIATNAGGKGKLPVETDQWMTKDHYRVKFFRCVHHYDSILSVSLNRWLSQHASDYDVVHTHNLFAPTMAIARWICKKKQVPYVVTPHGMLEPWALSYKSSKKKIYYQRFEAPSLETASAIHVLNRLEEKNVETLGFSKTVTIPNGIHREDFESLPSAALFDQQFPHLKGKKKILFLGRIDPKKGLDLLAPAFAKAHQQFPDIHLVVAGPDSIGFMSEVQNYFDQADCASSVTFTGMITGELKRSALAAASVYVAPSYSEGFSMSILEGMAAGLPCIITEACNFPEAGAAHAAHVVDVNSNSIADSLFRVLNKSGEGELMGQRARKLVFQEYTWDCAADKLSRLYQKISPQTARSPVLAHG